MITSIPMNVCANPEPGIETNGELKPVAIAFASMVLPVPGAPRKSSPRSRLPPARSKASPDCQRETIRRTSSFASAWPRTSSRRTPQSASPGSKPRIWLTPIAISGPNRITKLIRKNSGRIRICDQKIGEVRMCSHGQTNVSFAVSTRLTLSPGPARSSRPTKIARITRARIRASRTLRDQYQARRRLTTSSSRRRVLSVPNRLGQGSIRRMATSTKPRKAITIAMVATSDQPTLQPSNLCSQTKSAGLVSSATVVAARVSERHCVARACWSSLESSLGRPGSAAMFGVYAPVTKLTYFDVNASDLFAPEEIERARRYHRPLYLALALDWALQAAVLAAITFGPPGEWLGDATGGPWWSRTLELAVLVLGASALVRLPLSAWRGWAHERRWVFSTQSFGAWLVDVFKALVVGAVLTGIALLGLVWTARTWPQWWPAVASPGAAALTPVL